MAEADDGPAPSSANGTDVPVERIDPMPNLYATITRKTKDGTPFFPDQRMSREEALRSYTYNAAYAAKEERSRARWPWASWPTSPC